MDSILVLLKLLHSRGILQSPPDDATVQLARDGPLWILSRQGKLDEEKAVEAIAEHFRLEQVDLRNADVLGMLEASDFATPALAGHCWKHHLIPLYERNGAVVVATANPFDYEAIKGIEFMISKKVKLVVSAESDIIRLLSDNFPHSDFDAYNSAPQGNSEQLEVSSMCEGDADLDSFETKAPAIIRLTNKILSDAVKLQASDVHLEPGAKNMAVRFRIDGILQDIVAVPHGLQSNVIARLKILAGMDIAERRRPQDGRIRVKCDGATFDLRVSSLPITFGEKLVLRILRNDYRSMTFTHLGMDSTLEAQITSGIHSNGKLFLVCGPTGAGKTTTLYVCLNQLRDGKTNITTVEDPVEYRFPNVNQIQVNKATDVTFASVLRSILRQDPDIIMVGEIRDTETVSMALQAAQTGHLVLSTVHTNDAPSAIARLRALGADPSLLSASLIGVLAQRLVRCICKSCAGPPSQESIKKGFREIMHYGIDPDTLVEGHGCKECLYSGFKGRTGIYSYLRVNDAVAEVIFNGGSVDEIADAGRESGFKTLEEAALELLEKGLTTIGEVRPYLTLPTSTAEATRAPATTPPVRSAPGVTAIIPAQRGLKPRVLVIDDNASVRKLIITLLRKEMVDTAEAGDGLEGLELAYQNPPQLILCDISMPVMDGFEFLKKLKRDKLLRDTPVIMLTADDSKDKETALLEAGAVEFLSKRESPAIMVSRIRKVLDILS